MITITIIIMFIIIITSTIIIITIIITTANRTTIIRSRGPGPRPPGGNTAEAVSRNGLES